MLVALIKKCSRSRIFLYKFRNQVHNVAHTYDLHHTYGWFMETVMIIKVSWCCEGFKKVLLVTGIPHSKSNFLKSWLYCAAHVKMYTYRHSGEGAPAGTIIIRWLIVTVTTYSSNFGAHTIAIASGIMSW